LFEAISLEQNSADDPQEVGERKSFADDLCPSRHPAERKHEPGQEERRQKEEERHLHRLELVLRKGRERDPHRQVGADKAGRATSNRTRSPIIGTWNRKCAATRMSPTWT